MRDDRMRPGCRCSVCFHCAFKWCVCVGVCVYTLRCIFIGCSVCVCAFSPHIPVNYWDLGLTDLLTHPINRMWSVVLCSEINASFFLSPVFISCCCLSASLLSDHALVYLSVLFSICFPPSSFDWCGNCVFNKWYIYSAFQLNTEELKCYCRVYCHCKHTQASELIWSELRDIK